MKIKGEERVKLWEASEKALTLGVYPEQMRTSGLLSIQGLNWSSALLRLEEAVRHGIHDLQTLDALGEAAYQAQALEALLPLQNLYRDPLIAIHMARALMLLGKNTEAREFLVMAQDSLLKQALEALLGVEKDIPTAAASLFKPLFDSKQKIKPEMMNLNCVEYWQALAPVADAMGRLDVVALAERRLKALAFAKPVGHFNQSLRLLAAGEFRAGWKLYDWRLVPGSPCPSPTVFADVPMWEGEALSARILLVVLEDGFGDQIFGLRYLQALQEEGGHIEVAVGPELFPLVQSSFPNLKVHALKKAKDMHYWQHIARPDFWCYSFSVPARAALYDPVQTSGYLKASPPLVIHYRNHIQAHNPQNLPVYGLTWHGDIRTAAMRTRAYTVQEFLQESKILQTPCVIVCLQKDATVVELAELQTQVEEAGSLFINAAPTLQDFSQTAAWMNCLTRMWSCDTACAHAAGALNVPTTVLIRNKSIWHWRCDNNFCSVWYDSVQVQYALAPEFSYMFELRDKDV